MKALRHNQKGQGTTEYIVILAIVVGLAMLLIKTNLGGFLSTGINQIGAQITTNTQ